MPQTRIPLVPRLTGDLQDFLDMYQGEIAAGKTQIIAEMLALHLLRDLHFVPNEQPTTVVFDEHEPGANARSGSFFLEGGAFRFTCHRGTAPPPITR